MPIHEWIVTYYHFNKDGVIIDSPVHHYSIVDLQEHSQVYLKKFPNGKTALRWEKKVCAQLANQRRTGKSQRRELSIRHIIILGYGKGVV